MGPTTRPTESPLTPIDPTKFPTQITFIPTKTPTMNPTTKPTNQPSITPTINPSNNPTILPTINPTKFPTVLPTTIPTLLTKQPSIFPTINPSINPTINPTINPSINPTTLPTLASLQPTSITIAPSLNTQLPTSLTITPTLNPSLNPTQTPTAQLPNTNSWINCSNPDTIYQELKTSTVITCTITVRPGPLIGDSLALFIESPNTELSNSICSSLSQPSKAYPSSINSTYYTKWCYVDPSSLLTTSQIFEINVTTPSVQLDWITISLAIYQAPETWIKIDANWIVTLGNNNYNNFTFVSGQYSDFQYKELSKDVSIDVLLIVGACSVTLYICGFNICNSDNFVHKFNNDV